MRMPSRPQAKRRAHVRHQVISRPVSDARCAGLHRPDAAREHGVDDLLQPRQTPLCFIRGIQFERFEHVHDTRKECIADGALATPCPEVFGTPVQRANEVDLTRRKRFIVQFDDFEPLVFVSLQCYG
ncbi:hypothetical protein F01_390021 [Burkholderia cenocepacia]|nr:hypothetical protein F01_390021 [Burkholderia cenocepacia]